MLPRDVYSLPKKRQPAAALLETKRLQAFRQAAALGSCRAFPHWATASASEMRRSAHRRNLFGFVIVSVYHCEFNDPRQSTLIL